MLESLELHSYEWTVKAIKTRERLDKLDRRDVALSTFAMSRNKNLILTAMDLRALNVARNEDDTAEIRQAAARNARIALNQRIDELVADPNSPVAKPDRAALLSICSMNPTELQIYLKMMEVYDRDRRHFLFENVDPQVKRFLNAVYLWVAERISESNLLAGNRLTMSNQAWLANTIALITLDERLVLHVLSLQERSTFDNVRGYELADLETSISNVDATTLKLFRQSACQDPVTTQILMISKLQKGNSSNSISSSLNPRTFERHRFQPKKEQYAAIFPPKAKGGVFKVLK